MDPVAFKFLGAGLACIGMGLAAMGVGNIFGNFLSGALRNPSAADSQFARAFIGAALAEGLGIFCLVVALVLTGPTTDPAAALPPSRPCPPARPPPRRHNGSAS